VNETVASRDPERSKRFEMSDNLHYLSATDALAKFASGELSPVTLMQAIIDRAHAVEPTVNAFSHRFYEEAMAQAREAEQRYVSGSARPLEGLPLAVKDSIHHKDKPYAIGSLLLKDNIGTFTEPWLQRLLDAGVIVHARTTTPEFLFNATTHSRLNGVTRNPWNPAFSAGASSGGAGAALAAGTTTLALGTDAGGSIRLPASQNGVIGFKPPTGRVPAVFPNSFDSYYMNGPMARTVADAILIQNIIAGHHPEDMESLYPDLQLPTEYPGIEGMRLAYTLDFGYREVDDVVRDNTLRALERLRSLGAEVVHVDLGWTDETEQALLLYSASYNFPLIKKWIQATGQDTDSELLSPYISMALSMSTSASEGDFIRRGEIEDQMYKTIGPLLTQYDALIAPTTSVASVPADWDPSQPIHINGKAVHNPFAPVLTPYFNALGRVPVINVPTGRDQNNVPTGMQIVGPAFRDQIPFRVAMAYESRFRFFDGDAFPRL